MAKKKSSKRKQPDLPEIKGPGVEQVQIIEIDDVAEEYVGARDDRMAKLKIEVDAKSRLKAVMTKHKLKAYDFDGYIVEVKPGEEEVKVRKKKTPREELEQGDND